MLKLKRVDSHEAQIKMDTEFNAAFFDDASKAWRENKVVLCNGMFRYKRNAFTETSQSQVKTVKETRSRPFLLRAAKKQR